MLLTKWGKLSMIIVFIYIYNIVIYSAVNWRFSSQTTIFNFFQFLKIVTRSEVGKGEVQRNITRVRRLLQSANFLLFWH